MSLYVWRGRVNTNENRLAQQAPPTHRTHASFFRCRAARLGSKQVLKATSVRPPATVAIKQKHLRAHAFGSAHTQVLLHKLTHKLAHIFITRNKTNQYLKLIIWVLIFKSVFIWIFKKKCENLILNQSIHVKITCSKYHLQCKYSRVYPFLFFIYLKLDL